MTREKWRGQKGPLYNRCVLKLFNKQTNKKQREREIIQSKKVFYLLFYLIYILYYSKFK